MKKIYIAGKVSGETQVECAMKFSAVQKQVEALGFEAINPLEVVGNWEATWEEAMKKCIKSTKNENNETLSNPTASIQRQTFKWLINYTACYMLGGQKHRNYDTRIKNFTTAFSPRS